MVRKTTTKGFDLILMSKTTPNMLMTVRVMISWEQIEPALIRVRSCHHHFVYHPKLIQLYTFNSS